MVKKIIRKHYLTSFYIITIIFSLLLLTLHFILPTAGKYSVSFTQLAPTFAVIFISMILRDREELLSIKSRFYFDAAIIKWIIPAIAIPSICIAISGYILSFYSFLYISWSGSVSFYILNIIFIFIGCAAEEIGWRGFLLPKLQKKHSPFISSIIVGLLWGVWHLNFMDGVLGFILYNITIIEMSILMTWIFNKTNGNLLIMIVWHFIFNLTSHILLWERFNTNLYIVESTVFGILCIAVLTIGKMGKMKNNTDKV